MRDALEEIHARGAELVIVGNGAPNFAAAFREDLDLDTPLFVDPDLNAYRAAGLRRGRVEALSPRMAGNAFRAMRSGYRQTAVEGDAWQLGGVFVLRPDGQTTFAYRSTEAGDHPPIEDILAALDEDAVAVTEFDAPSAAQRVLGHGLSKLVDPFIISSFDRTGFRIHSLTFDPEDLDVDMAGKRCVVTGANSGIGFETARALADLGADVVLLCRNAERGQKALDRIVEETGNRRVSLAAVDMSDLSSVREAATAFADEPIDVLVHNAGVLPDTRAETDDGLEETWATHVAGPFLLTHLLRANLEASKAARVIWVSSGGMYTTGLNLADPNWADRPYDGVRAYAETKRAQVILSELWAKAFAGTRVTVHAMHPGWADTPAVQSSLPRFRRVTERILRTPAEGADTVIWLAAADVELGSGRFWFDRTKRRTHFFPWTHATPEDRARLWTRCETVTGIRTEG